MLAATITIKQLDYEKTLQGIFPLLKEKLAGKESSHMTIRLFQKLDDAALPIALNVMRRLPNETKTELMVQILNTYSSQILNKLNEKLGKHAIGQYIHVGTFSIFEKDGVLYLWFGQIKADYGNIIRNFVPNRLGVLGGFAGALAGERLEERALKIIWNDETKQKSLKLARDVLDQYGIVMELDDIQLTKDTSEVSNAFEAENHLQLTEEMEMQILDALAGYLKDREGM